MEIQDTKEEAWEMATPHYQRLISADSHVMEPPDLWWNALGSKFGDRTPRLLDEYKGEQGSFFYSGYLGAPVQRVRIPLSSETEAAAFEAEEKGMGAVGYDPEVRVRFQAEASMDAEVMNPTTMLGVMRNPDVPVLQACSEVFNDWMAEFVSYDPQRLVGIGVIPMHDVAWAVEELNRTLNRGLNGPMINCQPPEGCPPYRDRIYDKFWAAAEEAGVPITLHILTGRVVDALFLARIGQTPEETSANPGLWIDLFIEIQTVLANDFIYGGILDRFPNLKVLCSEFEVSWIPGFMARLDQIEDVAPRLNLPKLNMKASDYMKTRVFHGFIDDSAAELVIPHVGVDRILWGSDFPHIRSIGLDAQSTLYQQLQSFSEEDQAKLVGENAVKVFGLE